MIRSGVYFTPAEIKNFKTIFTSIFKAIYMMEHFFHKSATIFIIVVFITIIIMLTNIAFLVAYAVKLSYIKIKEQEEDSNANLLKNIEHQNYIAEIEDKILFITSNQTPS